MLILQNQDSGSVFCTVNYFFNEIPLLALTWSCFCDAAEVWLRRRRREWKPGFPSWRMNWKRNRVIQNNLTIVSADWLLRC